MAAPIKKDLNRSGWESTDFPSVCESCLPNNPFVKMVKEDYGAECKLCTRPYTVFSWNTDRARGGRKRSVICLTCARLKNCCQSCMLDLSFGLPIAVRDAALKMVAPGPRSDVNREYFAQNNERAIEEGGGGLEAYGKTDEKARELLRRLAASKPYFRKGRAVDAREIEAATGGDVARGAGAAVGAGPVRTNDSRAAAAATLADQMAGIKKHGIKKQGLPPRQKQPHADGSGGGAVAAQPDARDWLPPEDENIMSLFVTGIEDDLPEWKLREFFKVHGKIKSLVCSHMSHCAFINYETRAAAELAAASCRGRAVIAGCPLRIRWGVSRAIGTMDREQRGQMLADARIYRARGPPGATNEVGPEHEDQGPVDDARAPPGADDTPRYASMAGE